MAVRGEVQHQQIIDARWTDPQGVLIARIRAFLDAQRAVATGEIGSRPALRQSCVDLAAAAEWVAEGLPAPPPSDD